MLTVQTEKTRLDETVTSVSLLGATESCSGMQMEAGSCRAALSSTSEPGVKTKRDLVSERSFALSGEFSFNGGQQCPQAGNSHRVGYKGSE